MVYDFVMKRINSGVGFEAFTNGVSNLNYKKRKVEIFTFSFHASIVIKKQ